ncbi:MAG: serine hydrolase domain-containing protein [Bacteroidota bacterium]
MLKKLLLFVAISSVFYQCNNPSATAKKKSAASIDSFFVLNDSFIAFNKTFVDSIDEYFGKNFNGTVLIAKGDHLFKKAYGTADGRKKPMPLDGLFQLASVSKTVTGVATLLLVQRNQIALDSLLTVYLPDFPYPNVTVRQLLSHRSGLANYMYYTDTFWHDTSTCMTNQDFYDFMVKNKPTPYLDTNQSFSYCNTNFAFLAVLIEKVSGLAFPDFVRENIFKPCGMRNSFYYGCQPRAIQKPVMFGRFEKFVYHERYYLDGILGDKGLYSSVEDLFMFHRGLLDGRLLNAELLELMQQPTYDHNIFGGSYGLGFRLKNTPNGQWTYHNGWWRGFWTFFWNRFDKKICMVILTNNRQSSHVDELKLVDWLYKTQ